MEKTVRVLEDHKNLIQSAAGSIASMGLDHAGKKIGGILVTPAVWALNHSATGAQPDKTDVGIYATGFLSAGASVAVGLLKAHVDDDMNKKLTEVQKKENSKWSPYIKNCYHFSSSAPAISAQIIASNGGTAWKHPNGLWVYITDARGRMVKDFKPNVYVVIYQPKEPLIRKNGKFVWGITK
ncbi:hypothetical protein [Cellvibrio sp. PSBB006]|uniref:hypothetical protein n=1 Tax=Cellvibrio sp. PSBB006 TaxID=1987723 RepID=UPI000B3B40B0|nr:hypothetical protein [Cellvibrio sp. PSBB006]ARU29188.1 hypothetical protein CBR65_18075 [Cellvibrio sp. PSBB006]